MFHKSLSPTPTADLRERIAAVAQRCLDAAQDNPESAATLEAHLNALVYEAYGLDDDDIAVIEGSLVRKKMPSIAVSSL